jgi:L-fuconolactonase
MRIDAHQHFWRYQPADYPWIGTGMGVLQRDYLPEDLAPLLVSNSVAGSIAVEARQSLEESHWLLELANTHSFILGVVGWVDLTSSGVDRPLERLSVDPKFRGVRHHLQDEPDDRFMLREDFLRGISRLAAYGLTYDLLIYPRHLEAACQLVSRFPRQRFVVDHLAKPGIRDARIEPWSGNIRRLARFENVFCKVSGLVTEADWQHWKPRDFWPYLDIVFEAFGASRIMVGSDWPVCTLAGSYAGVLGVVAEYVEKLSAAEQAEVWGGTAQRFYGLTATQVTTSHATG